jgi:hypothetical protein
VRFEDTGRGRFADDTVFGYRFRIGVGSECEIPDRKNATEVSVGVHRAAAVMHAVERRRVDYAFEKAEIGDAFRVKPGHEQRVRKRYPGAHTRRNAEKRERQRKGKEQESVQDADAEPHGDVESLRLVMNGMDGP